MSTESENVGILRDAYDTWANSKAANIDCWVSIIADDARLTSLADGARSLRFTSARSGRSEIIDYLKGLTADWEMIFYRIDEYVAQGERVVAIGATSWRNKRTGKIVVTPKVDLWRMRVGKVVQFSEFYDTARLFAAAEP
jgi:uncharacterized protein